MNNTDNLVEFNKIEVLESANNNGLKNDYHFFKENHKRVDLARDAYSSWNALKAEVIGTFEPALRQYFDAQTTIYKFTSGIYFYRNAPCFYSEGFVLPERNPNNGYADMYIRAFQDGEPMPSCYNISIFTTLHDNRLTLTNKYRLNYIEKLDYAIVLLSTNTMVLIDIKKARITSNNFRKVVGYNGLTDEEFDQYELSLSTIPEDCIDILGYEPKLGEYRLNGEEYKIKTGLGYERGMLLGRRYLSNMPKQADIYTIYSFNTSSVFTYSLKGFADAMSRQLKNKLNIDISSSKLLSRIRKQRLRADDDEDFFEIYIKEADATFIFTEYKHTEEEIKEFQQEVNKHQCKLHGHSGYVKKAERPKAELKKLIRTTRDIKPEDTLTESDLSSLDLKTLRHKNSAKLENTIHSTTEFIYGGVPKEEDTNERNNTKYLPAFYLYEVDEFGPEVQKELLDKALKSPYKDSIFFATWSGNKSLHITVWIDPCYRAMVATNYKEYWKQTAEQIFGTWKCFDTQCASIAHPARIPNGIRYLEKDNQYVIQSCWYLNKTPVGFRNTEIKQVNKPSYHEKMGMLYNRTYMQRVEANKNSEYGRVAYEVIVNNYLPSGEDYFKGLLSLFYIGASKEFIQNEYFSKVKKAHPSSLGLNSIDKYWSRYVLRDRIQY